MVRILTILLISVVFAVQTAKAEEFSDDAMQIIIETKTVANLIQKVGGDKVANRLMKKCKRFENAIYNNNQNIEEALKSLQVDVKGVSAFLDFAILGMAGKRNTAEEIQALNVANKAQCLLFSIGNRINKIIGKNV